MANMSNILIFIIGVPIISFGLEFFFCRINSKVAVILPIVMACFFVVLGFYALIIAAIMFGIYFVMRYLKKEKQVKLSEIEKMNIEDL